MEEIITRITIVVSACAIAIPIVINLIQHIKKGNLEELEKWIEIAVKAAEQIFSGAERGTEKKVFVEQFADKLGYSKNGPELTALIEATVFSHVTNAAAAEYRTTGADTRNKRSNND